MAIQHLHSLQHPVQDGAQGRLPEVLSEWKWVSPWLLIKVLWFKRLQLQIHPGRQPLRSSLSMPLRATCKRDTFKSKEQRNINLLFTAPAHKAAVLLCLLPARSCHPRFTGPVFSCIWENTGSPPVAPPPANLPREHTHTLTHTLRRKWKQKQGENCSSCHIPAARGSSRVEQRRGHFVLARASRPTTVNPSVADCRTRGGRSPTGAITRT